MAKVCQFSGKKPGVGNKRSHSLRATKRKFNPNVSKQKIVDPVTGEVVKVKISTRAKRTFLKNPGKFAVQMKSALKKQRKRVAVK